MKGYAFLAWMFFGVALEATGWWARVVLWQDVWSYGAMIASLAGLIIGKPVFMYFHWDSVTDNAQARVSSTVPSVSPLST